MINVLCVSNLVDTIIYGMFSELRAYGYKVFITATTEEQVEKIEKGGCHAVRIPNYNAKFSYKAIKSIRNALKQNNIQVVYAINSSDLSNSLFASYGLPIKTVAYRGTQAKIRKSDPTYYLGILHPKVSHIVCATEDIYLNLQSLFDKKMLTLNPKPYKVEWVSEAIQNPKKANDIPDDAFLVTHIALAKNRPFKGLSNLIEGFHLIDNSAIYLLHIGDYDEVDFNKAKSGKNADRIHFIGKQRDAVHYLPKSNVCICPSTRDASPRSLREAMACEVACIVTDIPGARDLVKHNETGLVIEPNSQQAIAEAITNLAGNKDKTRLFGINGREYILSKFSMEKYLHNFDTVFRNLVEEKTNILKV